jgi:predicted enzyme related to lactoylglutathione lyase
MRNAVYWVELPVKEFARAKQFYETVFEVSIELVPIPRGRKYGIFPLDVKALGAGLALVEGTGYEPTDTGSILYIDRGESLDGPLSRVETAGGKILLPKAENSGGNGFIAQFRDSEGNRVGLHSSD